MAITTITMATPVNPPIEPTSTSEPNEPTRNLQDHASNESPVNSTVFNKIASIFGYEFLPQKMRDSKMGLYLLPIINLLLGFVALNVGVYNSSLGLGGHGLHLIIQSSLFISMMSGIFRDIKRNPGISPRLYLDYVFRQNLTDALIIFTFTIVAMILLCFYHVDSLPTVHFQSFIYILLVPVLLLNIIMFLRLSGDEQQQNDNIVIAIIKKIMPRVRMYLIINAFGALVTIVTIFLVQMYNWNQLDVANAWVIAILMIIFLGKIIDTLCDLGGQLNMEVNPRMELDSLSPARLPYQFVI